MCGTGFRPGIRTNDGWCSDDSLLGVWCSIRERFPYRLPLQAGEQCAGTWAQCHVAPCYKIRTYQPARIEGHLALKFHLLVLTHCHMLVHWDNNMVAVTSITRVAWGQAVFLVLQGTSSDRPFYWRQLICFGCTLVQATIFYDGSP